MPAVAGTRVTWIFILPEPPRSVLDRQRLTNSALRPLEFAPTEQADNYPIVSERLRACLMAASS